MSAQRVDHDLGEPHAHQVENVAARLELVFQIGGELERLLVCTYIDHRFELTSGKMIGSFGEAARTSEGNSLRDGVEGGGGALETHHAARAGVREAAPRPALTAG